ncbi:dTDP-4-dehydrorhamnose reductase [Clostridium oceanicum]|uniref:dTDP-4-dehydrorhamnose reductase n=1 Tax=Clostridium oceanicum TaxID=1543 RepID=A0ABN1JA42_9CLOT
MVILITGAKGQLGNEIKLILENKRADIGEISKEIISSKFIFMDSSRLDISNLEKVNKVLTRITPDVVINCAAFTNVDRCEENKELAFKANSFGPRNLAIVCEKIKAKLVQISTDYVFSSKGKDPLREYDETKPCNTYGKTKLMGENFVRDFCSRYFIIRTSWLYGHVGKNFVYTIMKLAKEKENLKVVNDQEGNPTNANDLAYHILKIISTENYGIYNCTGKGEVTRYDFAKEIIRLSKIDCKITPCTSDEFKTKAKRPNYSCLDNMMLSCTIGDKMRFWKEALNSFINDINK